MCQAAQKSAAAVLSAVEPDLVELLTIEGIASTPDGQSAIAAYNALDTALQNWVPGTSAQVAIEAANAFTAVFQVLPIPTEAKGLEALISAAIVTVIGILTANSPAPAGIAQAAHAETVASATEAQVTAMTGIKVGWFTLARVMAGDHSAIAEEWQKQFKAAAKAAGPKYAPLAA